MKKSLLALLCLLWCTSVFGQFDLSESEYDSLVRLLPESEENTAKVDILFALGAASQFSNTSQAVQYFNEALQLARKIDDKSKIWGCLVTLGFLYARIGEPAKSIELLQEALVYAEQTNQDESMPLAFIANGYEAQGDLKNAVDYARRSYTIYEKRRKDGRSIDERGYPAGPMRLGQLFEKTGQLDSAKHYAQMSYQRILEKPLNGEWDFFYCEICNLMGNIQSRLNKPAEALRFYRTALNKAISVAYVSSVQESQLALAKFYHKYNEPDSAIYYAVQAYEGATKIKGFEVMKESAIMLRTVYEKQGEYAKALFYNDFAVAARDSVSGAEKVREVQSLTFKEEQRQQKMQQEMEAGKIAYRNSVKMYALLAIMGGLLSLATILYLNVRQKRRANGLLLEQKEEISTQKTQLQSSLENLRATQSQLIQSEKLASLGELTAGIAHEIQNPLNFVNNFSELSVDLANELKEEIGKLEIPEKDKAYVGEILGDLSSNQQKINLHGKRASSIVTGMLQHARTSTGKKEPTDINALADEYLRLSYHGLRAKDPTFNAKMTGDFDPEVGKLDVIPQDIGRVLLNLINNAFYAVSQRSLRDSLQDDKSLQDGKYEPTVTVTTKKLDDKVEIRVQDNGTGIPESVKAKIFQPFFTTKPTGQGTGLGLSLAYDIVVKGHGGTLEVESTEGLGTTFIIQIPF